MEKKVLMKFVIAAIAAFTTCVGFTGCMDDVKDFYKGGASEEPNVFDFSTKKTVEINLKYDVPIGYRVHVELYSKSPLTLDAYKSYVKDSTLVPFFSGKADKYGKITYKGDLSATVNEIYAYCSGFGMPILMKASVNDAGIVSDFKVAEIRRATTRAVTGASGTSFWGTYDVSLSKPDLTPVSREILQEDKNLIEKSFPTDQSYGGTNTYYQPSIRLNGEAKVKIYSVSNGGSSDRTNALAYFVYDNTDVKPADINSNLNLVFPELNKKTPVEGAGYQLLYNGEETFEAGTNIGFALFPDVKSGNIVTDDAHLLYSYYTSGGITWNNYKYPGLVRDNVPHMVLSVLREDVNGNAIIAIAFEDQPWDLNHGTNKGDFRDDIFILEVDPASSLPDLPTPPVEDPEYNSKQTFAGILCFEDCWPDKGDYDMNDVVVSYERALLMKDKVPVAMKETYTFLNNGADFVNGFGYQLSGLNKSNIMKCTVESSYNCEGQGLDATMNDATVMLFDDGRRVPSGTTFSVYTSFSNGNNFWADVNPFLVLRGYNSGANGLLADGRKEVHLPTATSTAVYKYLPTSKASTDYWGTSDDKSNPDKKIYYVRTGNYPFALDIKWDSSNGPVTNFVIPTEKESIEKTYPDFTKWVNSKGEENKDWYLHPKVEL